MTLAQTCVCVHAYVKHLWIIALHQLTIAASLPAGSKGATVRIFASWSGKASREIAVLLKEWIPNVLQDVEVYVSSQDISKGERWLNNVNTNLQDHNFGISIVTAENHTAPWILFEAGALAKTLNGRLIPLLCGIDTISLPNHPLTQFQYVIAPGREEMFRLMQDINLASDRPLSDERLKATYDKWYPDLETGYNSIDLGKHTKDQPKKSDPGAVEAILNELMREMRDLRTQVSRPNSALSIESRTIPQAAILPSNAPPIRAVNFLRTPKQSVPPRGSGDKEN